MHNFGGNLQLEPATIETPADEREVLELLARHRGRRIRAIGRLHSWSEAPQAEEVLVDLRRLNSVQIDRQTDEVWATVGGGCQIKRLLAELDRQAQATLPSVGLIDEQTIAGAVSTGTHGSGKHSLSHYMDEIRLAMYDAAGEPVVRTVRDWTELRAARCSLGCLGIIVSVKFKCRPQYQVEEHFREHAALDDVLRAEDDYPLQQFFLVPWRWTYFGQHRREVPDRSRHAPRDETELTAKSKHLQYGIRHTERDDYVTGQSSPHAPREESGAEADPDAANLTRSVRATLTGRRSWFARLYRLYWFLGMDIGLHLLVLFLARVCRSGRVTRFFFRRVLAVLLVKNWRVVDKSQDMLLMEHELFRHIEIEMFVERRQLPEALDFVRASIEQFDGDGSGDASSEALRERKQAAYTHHYPICVRRVLRDDTLISMASGGDEPWYAISLISYARPKERESFFRFAQFLSARMVGLFGARPHWGKVCPISAEEARQLYPRLPEFRAVCREMDPVGVFRNRWITDTLFPEVGRD